jgi:hypothetical protein
MDLRTFISESLIQIANGVADAREQFKKDGTAAEVNPSKSERGKGRRTGDASPVEFDVAVTVADETRGDSNEKIGGKAGLLSVVSLQASAEVGSGESTARREQQVSRIRFKVLLAQPSDVTEYSMRNDDY